MTDNMIELAPGLANLKNDINTQLKNDPRLKSNHTRRGYLADLLDFEKWRGNRLATKTLVETYAAELQASGQAPATINRKLAAVRWWARRLADLVQDGVMPTTQEEKERRVLIIAQAERIAGVGDVKGTRPQKGRHIASGELSALMAACENDSTPAGARDAALIALAWSTGLRRDELAQTDLEDLATKTDSAELTIRRGKGDKARIAYVYNGALSALSDWLLIRGNLPGPIFCTINKGKAISAGESLSGESLRMILEKRLTQARVKPLTWHDFRRTFAGNLLDSGVDLVTVSKLMGHSSTNTTAKYDRRGEEVKQNAVKTLHVPYRGRMI